MSLQLPSIQRAWVAVAKGTPEHALRLKDDWPVPKNPKAGEIVIKVQAAALNPIGYKLLRLLPNFIAGRPRVIEMDLSGVVVDSNSPRFKVGDEVYGWIPGLRPTMHGALAQYTAFKADFFVPRPSNTSPIEAAGLTVVTQTAYFAAVVSAKVQAGQRVFINGGSTAVGAFTIQIAKARGAHVTASASAKNEEFVRRMGADEFVDYTTVDAVKYLKENSKTAKYDYILEAAGIVDHSLYTQSEEYLNPKGLYQSVGPSAKFTGADIWSMFRLVGGALLPGFLGGVRRRFGIIRLKYDTGRLEATNTMLAEGTLKPIVDSVFEFEDALKAYDRILSRRATGKVVVRVDPSVQ